MRLNCYFYNVTIIHFFSNANNDFFASQSIHAVWISFIHISGYCVLHHNFLNVACFLFLIWNMDRIIRKDR